MPRIFVRHHAHKREESHTGQSDTVERVISTKNFRRMSSTVGDALNRQKLCERLRFEMDLIISFSRLAMFLVTMFLTVAAIFWQRDLESEALLSRQIREEFAFEDLTGTFTSDEELWEYADKFAETSRSFMPLSSAYIKSSSDRVLLSKPQKFTKASVMPVELELFSAWSFTVWAQALQSGLQADLVTRRLASGQTCWSWGYPASFSYGEHEFGLSAAKQCCDFKGDEEEELGNVMSSKGYQLMALVFNGSHLQFFAHNSSVLSSSSPLPIQTTSISDCELGLLRIGDRGLRLAQLQFFGRALEVFELEEISRFGQPLAELAYGQEPTRASEEIDSADIISQEIMSVQVRLSQDLQHATGKLEAMHVTNARSIEQAVKDLLESDSGRLSRDDSNNSGYISYASNASEWNFDKMETNEYTEFFSSGVVFDGKKGAIDIAMDPPVPYFDSLSKRSFAFSGFVKSRLETPMLKAYSFFSRDDQVSSLCHGFEYGAASQIEFYWNANRDTSVHLPEGSSWNGYSLTIGKEIPAAKNIKKAMWRHLAVTVVGVDFSFYYDGRLAATGIMDEPLHDCVDPILRISVGDGLHEKPQGYAKFRLWKRLPSADEIFAESADTQFRECRLLDAGEVHDDSVWLTSNGHSCAWFASKVRENPDMRWCTDGVREKCPVACQSETYCHSIPATSLQVFPDVLRFDRDTLCIGKDVNVERMFQECLNWTSKPKRRLHNDWKKRIQHDTTCEGFREALDSGHYCRFDQQAFKELFGGQQNYKPDQFTIAFWSRHFSRGFAAGVPGWSGTWASHCKVFPEQFQKYVDGDMVYVDRTGFEFVYDPNGTRPWDFSYFTEDTVGKDHDEWLFHSVSYDGTDPKNRKWSMLVGRNYAEVDAKGGEPTVCSIPEAFTFAIEAKGIATGDARLANFRFFDKKMSRGELQYMLYQEQDEFRSASARPGPSTPAAQMVSFGSQTVRSYSNAAVFVAPPLITSSLLQTVPCEAAGAILAGKLKKRLDFQELRLKPFCAREPTSFDNELMRDICPEPAAEVLSCAGQDHSEERFFGIDASQAKGVWPYPLYTDLLYSFSAPLLVRDGKTFNRERYITARTDWMSLIAVPYDSVSMTVGVLKIDFFFSGTKHIRIVPSLSLITFTKDDAVPIVLMVAVSVMIEVILLLAWAAFARRNKAKSIKLDALRSPGNLVRSLLVTLIPAIFLTARFFDLTSRLNGVDTSLRKLIALDFGSLDSSSSKVMSVQIEINAMVKAMDAEMMVRLVTFFLLFAMFLRLLHFLKVHSRVEVIVATLESSIDDVFHFMISLGSVLILFSIIGMYAFGSEREEFKSTGATALTLMKMSIGDEFPWNPHGETVASTMFLVMFTVIVMFLLVNALLGIVLVVFDKHHEELSKNVSLHQNIVVDIADMLLHPMQSFPRMAILAAVDGMTDSSLTASMLASITGMPEDRAKKFVTAYSGFAEQDDHSAEANAEPIAESHGHSAEVRAEPIAEPDDHAAEVKAERTMIESMADDHSAADDSAEPTEETVLDI